jgi:4-hydroxy-tetrahydrodipicolinate synthase
LTLDQSSLAREVEHYGRIGAVGVVVLGVFGEAASLDDAERETVIEVAVRASAGMPVVVGIDSLSTAPVIFEARRARQIAGDRLAAVMIRVNSGDAEVLATHLRAVHEACGVGIVLQHYPEAGGASIARSSLVRVLADVPAVVAVKCEASPTTEEIHAIASSGPVPAFGGLGGTGLLDELAAGSAGAMTGFSCPEGLVACVEAYRSGGPAAAREAWLRYLPLVNFEFQRGIALSIRKESLRLRGLIEESGVRPPARSIPGWMAPLLAEHLRWALTDGEAVAH